MTITEFRSELDQLTKANAPLHAQSIATLHGNYPHTISLVKDVTELRANCHMYALDLVEATEIIELLDAHWFTLTFGNDYIEGLINTGLLTENKQGSVVAYFNSGKLTHTGRVIDDGMVESKWGGGGNVWRHGMMEIPLEYGEEYKLLKPASQDELISAFKKYAQSKRG